LEKDSKIYVAGVKGMVGSAIARALKSRGYTNIVGHSSGVLDLTRQVDVEKFFSTEKPEYIFMAAAKVGGIHANSTYPADFIYSNLQIQNNVIHTAHQTGVKKLLFLGSSCIYPKHAPQPMKEEYLLTGPLEPTNEAYAIAKIAGLKMCAHYRSQYGDNFISAMPTNLYGPGDNYDPMNSHVIPGLIRRFHAARLEDAPNVSIWGSGKPLREFLYVEDLADACVFLMEHYSGSTPINVGSGEEVSISDLANIVKQVTGYEGQVILDASKPDGTPRKLLDTGRLAAMGWVPKTRLTEGLKLTYRNFSEAHGSR
jgi:GDP-L-fucose synthase